MSAVAALRVVLNALGDAGVPYMLSVRSLAHSMVLPALRSPGRDGTIRHASVDGDS
jgi:hypothetical protein